jgi:uncharacterized protein related to proFAR isomerase
MEVISIIYLKKRKILSEKEGEQISLNDLFERIDKDKKIYVLDIDGIEKDKPNLCLYPKLSENHKIWVDAGPRVIGDVVDSIMGGATTITVRKKIWPEPDISGIKEITESEIYIDIDSKNNNMHSIKISLINNADGLVIFNDKNQIETDFKFSSSLKNLSVKYKIYVYESNEKNFYYWKAQGVAGILMDLDKIKEIR